MSHVSLPASRTFFSTFIVPSLTTRFLRFTSACFTICGTTFTGTPGKCFGIAVSNFRAVALSCLSTAWARFPRASHPLDTTSANIWLGMRMIAQGTLPLLLLWYVGERNYELVEQRRH